MLYTMLIHIESKHDTSSGIFSDESEYVEFGVLVLEFLCSWRKGVLFFSVHPSISWLTPFGRGELPRMDPFAELMDQKMTLKSVNQRV